LADYLWAQEAGASLLEEFAATFVDAEKRVANADEALEGARHIVAERIAELGGYTQGTSPSDVRRGRDREQDGNRRRR